MTTNEELRALAEQATAGEWVKSKAKWGYDHDFTHTVEAPGEIKVVCGTYVQRAEDDSRFIAAANPARVREQARLSNERLPGGAFSDGAAWLAYRLTREKIARAYWRTQGYDYDLHGLDGNSDYGVGFEFADAILALMVEGE